jgi:membrane protein implicated in regulation of membrane protease activity
MTSGTCANCKSKVEDGAVRCISCGAKLYLPGAFMSVVGWIVIAIALIPFAIALGVAVAVAGIVMVIVGRNRSKAAPPTVIEETAPANTSTSAQP